MQTTNHIDALIDQLFRHEYGKLVAVLTRLFGVDNLDLAEDVVQDSLVEAMKDWPYKGVPDNPTAWLYKVAKNKALNILNREKYKRKYTSDVAHHLQSAWTAGPALDYLFSEHEIEDDQSGIQHKSNVHALLALMFLNASRFNARLDAEGNILTLAEQDRSLWNNNLMQKGFAYLQESTAGNMVSVYHILATISAYHCSAPDFDSTDWKGILAMYDHLLALDPSSLVKLNRSIAVSKVWGPEKAIEELNAVKADPSFTSYHLLYSTEAAFYLEMNEFEKAAESLRKAIAYSPLQAEKNLLQKKLERCLEK